MPLAPSSVAAQEIEMDQTCHGAEAAAVQKNGDDAPACVAVDLTVKPQPSSASTALVPFSKSRKSKSSAVIAALKQKFFGDTQGKSHEELRTVVEERVRAEAEVGDASATNASIHEAQAGDIEATRTAYTEASETVKGAIDNEVEAVRKKQTAVKRKQEANKAVDEVKLHLLVAQKRLAMLEIMKHNYDSLRELEEQRKSALKAAMEAKRTLQEQRLSQKKALDEAMKKASQAITRPLGSDEVGTCGRKRKSGSDQGESVQDQCTAAGPMPGVTASNENLLVSEQPEISVSQEAESPQAEAEAESLQSEAEAESQQSEA